MRRILPVLFIIVVIGLLVLPIALVLLRSPQVATLLPIKSISLSNRYGVENKVTGYTLTLADASYLDYVTAKLDIFAPNAVVGTGFYTGKLANTKRQQINHITFVLADRVDAPISIVGNMPGLDCHGDYVLDGSTLVDRVVVGFDTLGKQKLMDKFAWENSFLRCALNTLYYAKGVTDPTVSYPGLVGIKLDIDKNVYSGLFAWPFSYNSTIVMNYRWLVVFLCSVGIAFYALPSSQVIACDFGGSCSNGTCVSCTYTSYNLACPYPSTLNNCTNQQTGTCCHITGQFPCTYCDNTGTCYYSCPAPTGGGGGGGGGGGPAPTSPPPPTSTPALPATLQAVAVQVTPVDTSCTAIHNAYLAGTGVTGTIFGFTVNPPAPQTHSGATLLTFSNVTPGSYTLTATVPSANWVVSSPCLYTNGTLVGLGYSAVANGGDIVKWEIGYTKGTAWVQTQGGDAYVSGRLGSYIPAVSPRVFNDVGAGGYPGVVTYGTSYDFDSDPFSNGTTLVSSKNWLVKATRTTVDYYDLFYHRAFGMRRIRWSGLFPDL